MSKIDTLRSALRALPAERWSGFLTDRSGLPGPRGNIELRQAFADEADERQVDDALGPTTSS